MDKKLIAESILVGLIFVIVAYIISDSINFDGWSLVLSFIGIFIAIIAIISAINISYQTKKQIMAQNILTLMIYYAGDEMLNGMNDVVEYFKSFNTDMIVETKCNMVDINKWKSEYEEDIEEIQEDFKTKRLVDDIDDNFGWKADRGRRKFSHFIQTVATLRENNIIDDKFVKRLVRKSSVVFLIKYVEPLEHALPHGNDPRESFNLIYRIFGLDHSYSLDNV